MDPRISRLEEQAARLARELADLRSELAAIRSAGKQPFPEGPEPPTSRVDAFNAAMRPAHAASVDESPPQPAAPAPARSWDEVFGRLQVKPPAESAKPNPAAEPLARNGRTLEDLIGRYGTIAMASLTILMGVGALLGWAIRNGYLGPRTRIGLGLLAAAALAVTGWRIRRGDSPRYGNALLALALAVVHVVAWGAGPRLGLVPIPGVLALAALASAALAALAWHEDDQALFNVGFGGALLAPFVTSTGDGDPVLLMAYGFTVLGAGIASLGQKSWTRAPLVASVGIVVYAATAETLVDDSRRWAVVNAPAAFALGLGALAIVLLEGRKRAAVVWPALLTALFVLVAVADSLALDDPQFGFAVVLSLAAMAAVDRELRGVRTAVLGALLIPMGATAVALGTLADVASSTGALVALGFGALCAVAAWKDLGGERGTWAFTATGHVGLAIALASDERQVPFAVATAAFGVACALLTRRFALSGIGFAGAIWLTAATVVAFDALNLHGAFTARPFLTVASIAGAAVSAAWILLSWHTARNLRPGSALAQDLPRSVIRIAGWVVAFFWVRQELARAFSPDAAGFLLVAWYAVSGVGSIFVARARALPMLRQAGLGLALFAAVTAVTQASLLGIGWRVASYLLTGVFLLGVAWSYRITRTSAGEGAAGS